MSKEGADFLGTLFESLREAGGSVCEVGGGGGVKGKGLRVKGRWVGMVGGSRSSLGIRILVSPPHQSLRSGSPLLREDGEFLVLGLSGGNERLHFLLLLNLALAACLFRSSILSTEGFPASFLEAFSSSVDPGPNDFPLLRFALLCAIF